MPPITVPLPSLSTETYNIDSDFSNVSAKFTFKKETYNIDSDFSNVPVKFTFKEDVVPLDSQTLTINQQITKIYMSWG